MLLKKEVDNLKRKYSLEHFQSCLLFGITFVSWILLTRRMTCLTSSRKYLHCAYVIVYIANVSSVYDITASRAVFRIPDSECILSYKHII